MFINPSLFISSKNKAGNIVLTSVDHENKKGSSNGKLNIGLIDYVSDKLPIANVWLSNLK